MYSDLIEQARSFHLCSGECLEVRQTADGFDIECQCSVESFVNQFQHMAVFDQLHDAIDNPHGAHASWLGIIGEHDMPVALLPVDYHCQGAELPVISAC
jgi:hypothetical protein